MRYFLVSEDELERLHSTAFAEGVVFCGEGGPDYDYERFKSDDNSNLSMAAACARPVPEWATHFTDDIEFGLDYDLKDFSKYEEIKR